MATTAVRAQQKAFTLGRSQWLGIVFLIAGLLTFLFFGRGLEAGIKTKFGLNPGFASQAIPIPDLVLPTQPTIYAMVLIMLLLGVLQLVRGFRFADALLGVVALCFVFAFLTWAARGKSFNLVGMLGSSLVRATPIALAALCGIMCERSGVVNIAIEGIMLISAQVAVVVATVTKNLYAGLVAAILSGAIISAFHAAMAVSFKVDQIVSATAINIFATGATSFISARFLEKNTNLLNNSGTFRIISIPLLSKIPILGPIFFENGLIVYLMLILTVLVHILLFYTKWGLRVRAVGEHPRAADTLGINVYLVRYVSVILGGMIAGIGGAYFTIGSVGRFDEIMTAGKGFIGLAAMIFGKWAPFGAFASSILFGFADSLQIKLQILRVPIPSEFLLMAPYIVTMIVLTGVVGRAEPPAADGQPYEK
ncbi:MAG: ABC transporter permease [Chloroflexi bacterium]|nr:ABC transporter permease [Chloroflexota bacterium]